MLLETMENGCKVYGTDYSGRYVTYSHAPNKWRVWAVEDYQEIKECWKQMVDDMGIDFYHVWDKFDNDLERAAVATFRTRKEARAYIESIGGTWK